MMQPNHANMDNLQCFNSLIFNSSKSPDSAKPNGPSPSPRLSRLTSTRNSVPTRAGANPPIIPFGNEKNAEREIIHGRWAQLGVTGAWAAENGTGIPWFTAGTLCTPDDCTAIADKFPGAVAPLAPEGSGYPSFWNVLIIETVLVGGAEAYRTGLAANPFDDGLVAGDVSPGGRFDPLGLAESGDLEELKIKELKHCRLSMFAWLGCIFQALATQEGPIANWTAHTADPVHANVLTNAAKGFGFY
ncbi:unnamed protein product [Bathycoccus prasinos]